MVFDGTSRIFELYASPTTDGKGFSKPVTRSIKRYMRSDSTSVIVKMEIKGMSNGQKAGISSFQWW